MAEFVKLNPAAVQFLHEQNPDLVSYNVEFAEVTGGTFWKSFLQADLYSESHNHQKTP